MLAVPVVLGCGDRAGPVEPATARVTGRVVDAGEAVVGAQVSIGPVTAYSGSDGRFELTGVPPGPARVRCVAAGFVEFTMDLTVPLGGVDVEVLLERQVDPPASVTGVVLVASTGAPLAGAQVSIGEATTSTASNGRYELNGLVAGSVEIRAVAAGFEEHRSEITLYPGEVTANIALRSLSEPGLIFDLSAPVRGFDPVWGDQTGAIYTAVLTLPADYRAAARFAGTMSEWRYVGGGEVHDLGTSRITGTADSGGGMVIEADRLWWTMSGRVQTSGDALGSWGCCGHMSGSFTAVRRPPS